MIKKKLLVVTPRFPMPVLGGDKLRIYNICKELSANFELTLVSLTDEDVTVDAQTSSEAKIFSDIHVVKLSKLRSIINVAWGLLTNNKPMQVNYYQSRKFQRLIEKLAVTHDVVLNHLVRTTEYTKHLPIPKVLEMTDAISLNYQRIREKSTHKSLKSVIYQLEQARLLKYERSIMNDFDLGVLISQVDKDYLFADSELADKIIVSSNGVDFSTIPNVWEQSPISEKRSFVFLGNMRTVQNMDGALWFARNVLPTIRSEKPDFYFKVVGLIPDKYRQELERFEGVKVTGKVDSVFAEFRDAVAGVCSVQVGAGVQNKVLEYMAAGLPTISSVMGIEGIPAVVNQDVLVADSPMEFAKICIELSEDDGKMSSLSRNGRDFIHETHSWAAQLNEYSRRVYDLVNFKPSSSGKTS